jgi:RES domain-containing protein
LIRVWRICARRLARHAFRGEGARLHGGRWNPPGIAVVYTASTLSLAALELFVNLDPRDAPAGIVAIPADIPASVRIESVDRALLPRRWRSYPAPDALQAMGAAWIARGETAVLSVPSAVIPEERNYLLNPAHRHFHLIRIGRPQAFQFDTRMWQ